MDLAEHALSESDRILKRLGITVRWCARLTESERPDTEAPTQSRIEPPPTDLSPHIPPLLRSLFHGKHPPVQTLWSYAELTNDLQALETSSRLNLFRKIQQAASAQGGWNPDDICVWPIMAEPHVVEAGLDFFRPQRILFFGPTPKSLVGTPEGTGPHIRDIPVVTLPSLDDMLSGDKTAKNAAWAYLRNNHPD